MFLYDLGPIGKWKAGCENLVKEWRALSAYKLTIKVDRPQLSPEDIKKLEEATRNNKMAE